MLPSPPTPEMGPPPIKTPVQGYNPAIAIGMQAAGASQIQIAKVFGKHDPNVNRDIKKYPGGREMIAEIREKLKEIKIQRLQNIDGLLLNRLEGEIPAGDAKDIDALARAALGLEKIQVSVSGEATRVQVEQTGSNPVQDIKILVQNLLSEGRTPPRALDETTS